MLCLTVNATIGLIPTRRNELVLFLGSGDMTKPGVEFRRSTRNVSKIWHYRTECSNSIAIPHIWRIQCEATYSIYLDN